MFTVLDNMFKVPFCVQGIQKTFQVECFLFQEVHWLLAAQSATSMMGKDVDYKQNTSDFVGE